MEAYVISKYPLYPTRIDKFLSVIIVLNLNWIFASFRSMKNKFHNTKISKFNNFIFLHRNLEMGKKDENGEKLL